MASLTATNNLENLLSSTSSSTVFVKRSLSKETKKQAGSHSPLVLAMLRNNRMQNCIDIQELYNECISSKSNDRICKTATSYMMSMCNNNNTSNME